MDPNKFSLIYFTADTDKAVAALNAGVDAVLIDCENKGKENRQTGFNTEINYHTPEDIRPIRQAAPSGRILCRVNAVSSGDFADEINAAFDAGASGIVLPMVETEDDVSIALDIVAGRGSLTVMVETEKGFQNLSSIVNRKGIDSIYVGLNDLSISRGGQQLFKPLVDGTIKEITTKSPVAVGVGGVTDPLLGFPVSSNEIIKEYQALGVKFSILRRSFEEAIKTDSISSIVKRIHHAYELAGTRASQEQDRDSINFEQIISKLQEEKNAQIS